MSARALTDEEIDIVRRAEEDITHIQEKLAAFPEGPERDLARRVGELLSFWFGVAQGTASRAAALQREIERLEAEVARLQERPAQIAQALIDASQEPRPNSRGMVDP